jgi:NhaA family Na+:H+ antiporter
MILTKLYTEFFRSEKTSGIILLFATAFSLIIANSAFQVPYLDFWATNLGGHTIGQWVNDGLMAIFFLMIGLELEREIYEGELSSLKKASLPIAAALGGMIVPAAIYLSMNFGLPTQDGAGIPMATDIAFAIGILSLLGNKVPASLKIFLTALAVIDDLGAVVVIALFYTKTISAYYLIGAFAVYAVLILLNRLKVCNLIPYIVGGILMWYLMLHSGVHATVTGVLLAFAIPFGKSKETSPSFYLQHLLHKPVAFLILPIFALANTGLVISDGWINDLAGWGSLGIIAGLLIGKPLGITLFSYLAVKFNFSYLPENVNWKIIIGTGFLAGIGFTMSIFITILAFDDYDLTNKAKMAILAGSLLSGVIGFIVLKKQLKTVVKD